MDHDQPAQPPGPAPGRTASIGELIRAARLKAGFTQQALARRIRCSKAQLSLMESDQRTVSVERAALIEKALQLPRGRLSAALAWERVPPHLRAQLETSAAQSQALRLRLKAALDASDPVAALRKLVEQSASNIQQLPAPLRRLNAPAPARGIPVINKVAAGYPAEFTDLDYPASVADEYVTCPDITDPDAFAARVVGDSMEPAYRQGDLVIFSPMLPTPSGSDCFVRLERDNETTFKRIYFEADDALIRLQPLNNAYAPRTVPREDVTGIYAAAYVMRKVNALPST